MGNIRRLVVDATAKEEIERINNERISERVKRFQKTGELLSVEDFVMVRVTNKMPRNGYVEPAYCYDKPATLLSPFKICCDDIDDSFILYFIKTRNTVHWTLNSRVSDHIGGSFGNRKFVIIEPYEFHHGNVKNEKLLRFSANDTYFKGPIKLSSQSTIMLTELEYESVKDDEEFIKMSENYDVVIYTGDEDLAITYILSEKGYIFGDVNAWSFSMYSNEVFEKLFITSHEAIAESMGMLTAPNHAYSEENRTEKREMEKNINESFRNLYDEISEICGIADGTNQELIEKLRGSSVKLDENKSYCYSLPYTILDSNRYELVMDMLDIDPLLFGGKPIKKADDIEDESMGKGDKVLVEGFDPFDPKFYEIKQDAEYYCVFECLGEYLCVPKKVVVELIGLEVIKTATNNVNSRKLAEAQKYREAQDKKLGFTSVGPKL